ncbi:hypothetical protein M758_4G193000 [Ceratodon purpureus]|nr:hypothetical protein M758_4G193000 [Ceratodon purpureus]
MGRFSPTLKLTCHGAMISTQSYLRPSQGASCYQLRAMFSAEWSRSLSLIRTDCSPKTVNYLGGSSGEAPVHCLSVGSRHLVSCREWLGRKVGQPRCGVSSAAGVRVGGSGKPQLGAAPKIKFEELGRYGIVEADYADVMISPQRPHSADKHEEGSSNTVSNSMAEDEFDRKRTRNPEEIQATECSENDKVEGNDWCTYLILSADKRKTYLGVTANFTRRLRQHNGELVGGAKAARAGRPWSLVCTVRGFATRSEGIVRLCHVMVLQRVETLDDLSSSSTNMSFSSVFGIDFSAKALAGFSQSYQGKVRAGQLKSLVICTTRSIVTHNVRHKLQLASLSGN